ncbi:MAG: hypothetical protein RIG61_11595 [Deltaproteobacteria bacterium]
MAAAKQTVFILILLILPAGSSLSIEIAHENIYGGILTRPPAVNSALIRSGEELEKAKEALGISEPLPDVDFSSESLILIVTQDGAGALIDIKGVEAEQEGPIEVSYTAEYPGPMPERNGNPTYTFLISKINHPPQDKISIRFKERDFKRSLVSGTGLGQFERYTNILSNSEGFSTAEFVPLGKGNRWTYLVKSEGENKEITNVIVAESDGWSVFDEFFGVPSVGMRIAPDGGIYVTSKGGMKTFYSPEVVTEYDTSAVNTPAGSFNELMIVTIPEGGPFWFRDVYAKGVGLVFHEHKSLRGDAEYTLIEANVGGRDYPPAEKSQ